MPIHYQFNNDYSSPDIHTIPHENTQKLKRYSNGIFAWCSRLIPQWNAPISTGANWFINPGSGTPESPSSDWGRKKNEGYVPVMRICAGGIRIKIPIHVRHPFAPVSCSPFLSSVSKFSWKGNFRSFSSFILCILSADYFHFFSWFFCGDRGACRERMPLPPPSTIPREF